jgi:hypothetical protein
MSRYSVVQPFHGRVVILALLALSLVLSGCQLPRLRGAELPDDGPPIATSQEAAQQFLQKITQASNGSAGSGEVALTVTQEEVTSFLVIGAELADQLQAARNLENLEDLADLQDLEGLEGIEGLARWQELARQREGLPRIRLPDLSLRLGLEEPEVRFQGDGQVIVRGYATVRRLRQPVRVVIAPRAADGELAFDFVEGKLGPLPLPEGLFDLVAAGLARAVMGGDRAIQVREITVNEGTLTLRGRLATDF